MLINLALADFEGHCLSKKDVTAVIDRSQCVRSETLRVPRHIFGICSTFDFTTIAHAEFSVIIIPDHVFRGVFQRGERE